MGAAATIDLLAKVRKATPAGTDQDHVPMLVHDVPKNPALHRLWSGPAGYHEESLFRNGRATG